MRNYFRVLFLLIPAAGELLSSIDAFAQIANDDLANAVLITGTNLTIMGSDINGTSEIGEPNHAGYRPTHSVWFAWTAPSDGAAAVDLTNSIYGSVLGVYQGKYVNSLALVSSNAFGNADGTA